MEIRKEKRFRERNEVLIKSASNGDESYHCGINAYTHDISLAGARICSSQSFEVGTVIRIEINLRRTGQAVVVDGEVKWSRDGETEGLFEMGVEFLHHISNTLLSLIKHLYTDREGIPSTVS